MVGEPVEQSGGHLGAAEDGGPFPESEVGGDDDGGPLAEPTDQVEEELSAGLGEREIAQCVEYNEVEPGPVVGDASLLAGAVLGLQPVDQFDDVEESTASSVADECARWPDATCPCRCRR